MALCTAVGLRPVCDPMNNDPRFVRNRLRHEVLPLLAEISGRDPVPLLARHAARAGEAAGLLAGLVADGPTTVRGWEAVATSYPGFDGHLAALRGASGGAG